MMGRAPKPKRDLTRTIHTRVDDELAAWLDKHAEKTNRNVSSVIRAAIREYRKGKR